MESEGDSLPQEEDDTAEFCDALDARQLFNERVMTGVRLLDGLAIEPWLQSDFIADIFAARATGIAKGWLVDEPKRILSTPAGRRHADSLAALFF